MSTAINIYPFSFADSESLVRFGAQTAIFLIGVFAAYKLIIKPALRLQEERKKRTVGNSDAARKNIEKANELEHDYFSHLKEGADAIRKLHDAEVLEATKVAHSIITETLHKSDDHIKKVREQLDRETIEAKAQLGSQLDDVVNTVFKKFGLSAFLWIMTGFLAYHNQYVYASTDVPLTPSFMDSVFWPYFQLIAFLSAAVYFGKKPLKAYLSRRREDLRTKLSEAHEAVYLSEKKMKEYQEKVASLQNELDALKARNMEDARLERERIIEDANRASVQILKDAERTATELIFLSKDEIKKELFALAINEVEKRLTEEKLVKLDEKLKQETIDNIKTLH